MAYSLSAFTLHARRHGKGSSAARGTRGGGGGNERGGAWAAECDPKLLLVCVSLVSGSKPTPDCCTNPHAQHGCLCQYLKDPEYSKYISGNTLSSCGRHGHPELLDSEMKSRQPAAAAAAACAAIGLGVVVHGTD
ncbi:hypothetical protein EJB05_23833, partial [Eragrostis curvula]